MSKQPTALKGPQDLSSNKLTEILEEILATTDVSYLKRVKSQVSRAVSARIAKIVQDDAAQFPKGTGVFFKMAPGVKILSRVRKGERPKNGFPVVGKIVNTPSVQENRHHFVIKGFDDLTYLVHAKLLRIEVENALAKEDRNCSGNDLVSASDDRSAGSLKDR